MSLNPDKEHVSTSESMHYGSESNRDQSKHAMSTMGGRNFHPELRTSYEVRTYELFYALLSYLIICYVMLRYIILCYVVLRYVMLFCDMLCYVMICYVILCMMCGVAYCSVVIHSLSNINTHPYTLSHTHIHKHTHSLTHTNTHTYTNTHIRTHPPSLSLPRTNTRIGEQAQTPWTRFIPSLPSLSA